MVTLAVLLMTRTIAAQNVSIAPAQAEDKTVAKRTGTAVTAHSVAVRRPFPEAIKSPLLNQMKAIDSPTSHPLTMVKERLNDPLDQASLLRGADANHGSNLCLLRCLASDQKQFWIHPKGLSRADAQTLFPFVAFTGFLVAGDHWIAAQVPDRPRQLQRSLNISNDGVYALAGAAGGSFLWGQIVKDEHLKESGVLSLEAAIHSAAIAYALSAITRRTRPSGGTGNGSFHGGGSFPSDHSAVAWSLATVMVHEYRGPLLDHAGGPAIRI